MGSHRHVEILQNRDVFNLCNFQQNAGKFPTVQNYEHPKVSFVMYYTVKSSVFYSCILLSNATHCGSPTSAHTASSEYPTTAEGNSVTHGIKMFDLMPFLTTVTVHYF